MAHYKRHGARVNSRYRGTRGHWLSNWPRWHDIVFHSRPRRRAEKAVEVSIVRHGANPDAVVWPLNKKPHVYYW